MATTNASPGLSVDLHYEDTGGDGRPVVLIHGWPLSSMAWKDNVGALESAGYRVVAYDRRGFGDSEKPDNGYDYDQLSADLEGLLQKLDLTDVTLVGFSMGGGEVARYVSSYGEQRLHSVVFASAVPPYMMKGDDNPEGPLEPSAAEDMKESLTKDRDAFFEKFTTDFFSAGSKLMVTESQRQEAVALCQQSGEVAALESLKSFGGTDFRADLNKVTVPTLVIHGDADNPVPFEGTGRRTHEILAGSKLVLLKDGPHGINVSHKDEFNRSLLEFLEV